MDLDKDVQPQILIVDDDSSVVITLNKVLKPLGRIRFAADATKAFALIADCKPDIILLDVQLPDMNGLTVCKKLKTDTETQDIPILFITSKIDIGFEEQVFEAGASDYIVKPLNPRVVAARTQTHLDYHNALAAMANLAHTDPITQLANRLFFDETLLAEFRRARRNNEPLAVVMLDIDQFKKFNDYFGHLKGDDCIRSIAHALKKCTRRGGDLPARFGGEEFSIILPNTDVAGCKAIIAEITREIEALQIHHAPDATYRFVTVSMGFNVIFPESFDYDHQDEWAAVKAADDGLYEAKANGRNCVKYQEI